MANLTESQVEILHDLREEFLRINNQEIGEDKFNVFKKVTDLKAQDKIRRAEIVEINEIIHGMMHLQVKSDFEELKSEAEKYGFECKIWDGENPSIKLGANNKSLTMYYVLKKKIVKLNIGYVEMSVSHQLYIGYSSEERFNTLGELLESELFEERIKELL